MKNIQVPKYIFFIQDFTTNFFSINKGSLLILDSKTDYTHLQYIDKYTNVSYTILGSGLATLIKQDIIYCYDKKES